jgi:predicted DNA-binding ribbon-helix-helix protein
VLQYMLNALWIAEHDSCRERGNANLVHGGAHCRVETLEPFEELVAWWDELEAIAEERECSRRFAIAAVSEKAHKS